MSSTLADSRDAHDFTSLVAAFQSHCRCVVPLGHHLDALGVKGQHFGYIFDMGDYWPHGLGQCHRARAAQEYPIIIEKGGAVTLQYAEDEETRGLGR